MNSCTLIILMALFDHIEPKPLLCGHFTAKFHTRTHIRLTALCPEVPGWASTRKVKPIWILLKQETVSGSDINWAICKSAPRSRQITTPAPHHLVFYRPDALPAAQPTSSKHWRHHQKMLELIHSVSLVTLFTAKFSVHANFSFT